MAEQGKPMSAIANTEKLLERVKDLVKADLAPITSATSSSLMR